MKWLICAMLGAVAGYCIFRVQNAEVHGELALEIHRNRVLFDRAERAEAAWMRKQLDALLVVPQPQPLGDGATAIPRMFIAGKEA